MGVDEPDATAVKVVIVDKREDRVMLGLPRPRQGMKEFKDRVPTCERAAGEFTDHERMADDIACLQEFDQLVISTPQVVDPDR